jgi:hypothetical protein
MARPTGAGRRCPARARCPADAPIWYQKHMTHHLLPHMDHGWIGGLRNVLLIRDPREVVASYVKSRAEIAPDDIGLRQQGRAVRRIVREWRSAPDHRFRRFPACTGSAPARALRLAWHRLQRAHAALAEGASRQRWRLGTALVCACLAIDRFRGAGAAQHRVERGRAGRRRCLQAALRTAACTAAARGLARPQRRPAGMLQRTTLPLDSALMFHSAMTARRAHCSGAKRGQP